MRDARFMVIRGYPGSDHRQQIARLVGPTGDHGFTQVGVAAPSMTEGLWKQALREGAGDEVAKNAAFCNRYRIGEDMPVSALDFLIVEAPTLNPRTRSWGDLVKAAARVESVVVDLIWSGWTLGYWTAAKELAERCDLVPVGYRCGEAIADQPPLDWREPRLQRTGEVLYPAVTS